MGLTACLLTRDEGETLARALRSLGPIADRILVVDTGSTDSTVQIARDLGAEVHAIPWDDDFAAGRNACLDLCRGDWVLWLNPDEEWVAPGREALAPLMEDEAHFGYFVRVLSPGEESGSRERPGESWDLRLFRNRPGVRFQGRIFPAFADSVVKDAEAAGERVSACPIVLRSLGTSKPQDEAKARWMIRLLEREIAEHPDALRFRIERARILQWLHDPGASQALAEVGDALVASGDGSAAPTNKAALLLETVLQSHPPRPLGRLDRDEAIRLVLKWFRDSPPILWTLAGSHYKRNEFAEAAAVLEHLVELGASGRFDRSRPFSEEVVGEQARMNLAACYARIGRTDAARALWSSLVASPVHGASASANLAQLPR